MPWKGHHHISTGQPATAGAECKRDVCRGRTTDFFDYAASARLSLRAA
jgi:hypothetical protein